MKGVVRVELEKEGAEPLDHKGEDPEGARLRDEGEGLLSRTEESRLSGECLLGLGCLVTQRTQHPHNKLAYIPAMWPVLLGAYIYGDVFSQ